MATQPQQIMKTHLEFQSNAFPPEPGEEDETNPGIFGKALARWLSERFKENGYATTEPIAEDWGWYVPLANDPIKLWLGCSNYGDDSWLVFIEPSQPFIRQWLKKIDTKPVVARAADVLERLVRESGASSMRWWSDHDSGRK